MKNKLPDPKKAKRYFAKKLQFTTGPVELSRWLKERHDIKVIDVRDCDSYAKGHIPGAVNLPKDKWHKAAALDAQKANIVYCYTQVCHLAAHAAHEFASAGFPVLELEGGFAAWQDMRLPVEKGSRKPAKKAAAARRPLPQPEEEPSVETATVEAATPAAA